jgi:hypothetical protein
MTPQCDWPFRVIDRCILRCASAFVPSSQRGDWRSEWRAELWHARQLHATDGVISLRAERHIAAFCLGAFYDALSLRQYALQHRSRDGAHFSPLLGSASYCLLCLGLVAALSGLLSLRLPGVRSAFHLASSQPRPGSILILDAQADDLSAATIAPRQFQAWKSSRQRYFDGLAFYRIELETVSTTPGAHTQWRVARANANLFNLLRVPVQQIPPGSDFEPDTAQLILSDAAFRREFNSDSRIIGSVINVGQNSVRIVGVAPDDVFKLPGTADAWLLESEFAPISGGAGYAVAHLTRSGQSQMWGRRVLITSINRNGSEHDFLGVSLSNDTPNPSAVFLFAMIVAFLALPIMTSISLGSYSLSSHKPSLSRRAIRFTFLIAKVSLILLIAYFAPVDLAYARITAFSTYIQLFTCFFLCLLGMRWVMSDHRQRCPVCLRRVAHPARVGLLSRTFLAWNGTELICPKGHTLLHVPGLPTSWFNTQRWMYLDDSWDFLFAHSRSA